MTPASLLPASVRLGLALALCIALASAAALAVWKIQGWRYGYKLEQQARLHADTLNELSLAGARVQQREQQKRLALERRLQANDETHHRELTDAQKGQNRVRDQLATAQLRLSVLLATTDTGSCPVSATTGPGRVVHGTHRVQLDPAYAQRIIGITDGGDRGLIALKACQAYAREVSAPK